jgi:hypothetical protein
MYVCYNNNTHAVLEVNASLESPMQGLHSVSLWMGMLCGATSPFDAQSYIRTSKSTGEHVKFVLTS